MSYCKTMLGFNECRSTNDLLTRKSQSFEVKLQQNDEQKFWGKEES